jgi:hypothetical protein
MARTVQTDLSIIHDAGRSLGIDLRGGSVNLEGVATFVLGKRFPGERVGGKMYRAYLGGLRAGFDLPLPLGAG